MSEARFKPYPIVLTQLEQVRCVVVGGGEVAARKIRALLDSGANVTVISPELQPQLAEWRSASLLAHEARPYQPGDLEGAFLAIAATDRREVNAAVAAEARERGLLCNVADDPGDSTFHTLGSVTRGDVLLAVATGGDSPALAAHIRRKLEATFGPEYGVLARRLGALRREIGSRLSPAARTQLWRTLASDEVLDWLRSGDEARLDRYIETLVAELAEH
ncbi:MAG TPA: bifunctional precorrin-2 dehydrogenase/sirohydrochlorin ferrochelatase [Herpetosiphonaceae bacterium]